MSSNRVEYRILKQLQEVLKELCDVEKDMACELDRELVRQAIVKAFIDADGAFDEEGPPQLKLTKPL